MVITSDEIILIDLLYGGVFLTLYIYKPKLIYVFIGLFCIACAIFHCDLMMNNQTIEQFYDHYLIFYKS